MTNPVQKDQIRRQKILEAATRVFEKVGLANASMRAIALEAGCTTGAIYPIFSGKEDITPVFWKPVSTVFIQLLPRLRLQKQMP
ncbi:MAG: helix-turn-helix transcriptional regulator [Sneathiella sp.]|nr:helix-turn-helix transcriptional regulator [Sneathiella sp.]